MVFWLVHSSPNITSHTLSHLTWKHITPMVALLTKAPNIRVFKIHACWIQDWFNSQLYGMHLVGYLPSYIQPMLMKYLSIILRLKLKFTWMDGVNVNIKFNLIKNKTKQNKTKWYNCCVMQSYKLRNVNWCKLLNFLMTNS